MGRPPKRQDKRLSKNRTFRVRGDLDGRLEASARSRGLSVSEEIERRLEQSFHTERRNLAFAIWNATLGANDPTWDAEIDGPLKFTAEIKKSMTAKISRFIASLPEAGTATRNRLSDEEASALWEWMKRQPQTVVSKRRKGNTQ